jgi:predicted house-cleaning noncanonical NTP pyrophosphatase (MazG superfamily)
MPLFKLNKLVRDKIVDDQIALGQTPHFRALTPKQHQLALIDKIIEEISELRNADKSDIVKELADVQQAIDDLIELHHITKIEVASAQKIKSSKVGVFKKGIYIDTLETVEDDAWTAYYRKDPKRFPEIG